MSKYSKQIIAAVFTLILVSAVGAERLPGRPDSEQSQVSSWDSIAGKIISPPQRFPGTVR